MAPHSIHWHDFEKMLVIRRLRQLVGDWWKVQLNFTDENGYLRGVEPGKFFSPIHTICSTTTANDKGFRACMQTVKTTAQETKKTAEPALGRCHAGFSTLSVPIRINHRYLGCVFADGFLTAETEKEQKEQIKKNMASLFSSTQELSIELDKLPILSKKEIHYLTELIKMVVQELLLREASLQKSQEKIEHLQSQLEKKFSPFSMIGNSIIMQNLHAIIEKIANTSSLVLIQGENGTGKELVAKSLHYNSLRKNQKFIAVNCGAFNENLLESELFGHVKGSFTGAIKDKAGLFEAANEGSLFLDEIGEMSLAMQVKLLRILQEKTYTPVGSTRTLTTTARVICATNRNLEEMVQKNQFREDLFYRLNVINLKIPPLRERPEDIPLLIEHFLQKQINSLRIHSKKLGSETKELLLNYSWPGNIRELENEIERITILSGQEEVISAQVLSERILQRNKTAHRPLLLPQGSLKQALEELESKIIGEGLHRTGGNKSKLAKELKISRASLIAKVEKYGLDPKRASQAS